MMVIEATDPLCRRAVLLLFLYCGPGTGGDRQGCKRDVAFRDRDETEAFEVQDRDETKTFEVRVRDETRRFRFRAETRPRR